MTEAKPESWAVTLTPNRSLSRSGFFILFGIVVTLNLVVAIFFWMLKAWPVFGFLGLDVALVWIGFRANERKAKCSERIEIIRDEVSLTRLAAGKLPVTRRFNRRWLRVNLEFDAAREIVGRLFLESHGRRTEIASFLGAEEKRALAAELRAAMVTPRL